MSDKRLFPVNSPLQSQISVFHHELSNVTWRKYTSSYSSRDLVTLIIPLHRIQSQRKSVKKYFSPAMRIKNFAIVFIAMAAPLPQAVGKSTVVGAAPKPVAVKCVCSKPGGGPLIHSSCMVCDEAPDCLHNDNGSGSDFVY